MKNKNLLNDPQNNNESSIFLQIGMKVKIKDNPKDFLFDSGKEKTITKNLPNYNGNRAFGLDGDDGIWLIEDFEYCINYPNLTML